MQEHVVSCTRGKAQRGMHMPLDVLCNTSHIGGVLVGKWTVSAHAGGHSHRRN